MSAAAIKTILVTGGNAGIGFALCRQLLVNHHCKVIMGSRNKERGESSIQKIITEHPETKDNLSLLQIDVSNDASVQEAANYLKENNVQLYALVNNAGVGLNAGGDILNVNFYGPKRCTDAFIDIIQERIVNVSSGSASMWLRNQNDDVKNLFTSKTSTFNELKNAVEQHLPSASMSGYGLSKAGLTAYTIQQSIEFPNLICTSLSPGFIQTKMTDGFGATLTPEEGTVSLIKCLFSNDVVSGYYYGSDGLRSPLTCTRDPGTPEYGGEENPDPSKYNK